MVAAAKKSTVAFSLDSDILAQIQSANVDYVRARCGKSMEFMQVSQQLPVINLNGVLGYETSKDVM